jgi:cardiolipin synthase A/B
MNDFQLLKNGVEYFPALVREIESAQSSVQIETYIFIDDEATAPIVAALMAAAKRGVKVRMLIDGIGSKFMSKSEKFASIFAGGIDLRVFNRDDRLLHFSRARLRRLHRKVVVVDSRVAFVGGINLVSDFAEPNPKDAPQFDYAVRIGGPLVATIEKNSNDVWASTLPETLRRKWRKWIAKKPTLTESANAAFVFRDNYRNRRAIERAMLNAFAQAKNEIILANAYFLPGWRFRQALHRAAARGVKITLLLQGYTDHQVLRLATRAMYSRFLHSNIYIAEYERSMLHAKVCVVDGKWATVGSSNLDPFSLLLAREANVVVTEPAFAQTLRTSLLEELVQNAASIAPTMWAKRGHWERTKSWVAYGVLKAGMLIAGLRAG